jgi:16S rRNA (cytosine1402-N4)-methyltransferase
MTLPFTAMPHRSVMLDEVIAALAPKAGGIYVDGTFGAGGYTRALLEAGAGHVYAIDRDPTALELGSALVQRHRGRLTLVHGRFGDMDALLGRHGIAAVDGVALDLGVSSMQLDIADRGFSFRLDGPLDMRMEGHEGGPSAADVVNEADEATLSDIIWRLGEERMARRVARAIVEARIEAPVTRTTRLAEIVAAALGPKALAERIHPATRTFQALRLYVNDELGQLERGLAAAERLLAPGGRLAIVSFHSLEDRAVKSFLKARSGGRGGPSRHAPVTAQKAPSFRLLFAGAEKPSAAEVADNPRSRSARLRAAERTAAESWSSTTEVTP